MARHFTKQEIEEIRKQLSTTAVRDLELPETSEMTDSDYVAVVQNGVNKKFNWAVISHAENERIANENERISAENARAAAEVSRSNTEEARVEAEGLRVLAENARVNAEASRVNVESSRVNAEAARVLAENARVEAETARETQAGSDHTRAEGDHEVAVGDHTRAGEDHTASETATDRANAAAAAAEHMVDIKQGPKGDQGNTGSSVDYPYELVNNVTTDDATKGLSAAQGVVLDGKISQLGQEKVSNNDLFDFGKNLINTQASGVLLGKMVYKGGSGNLVIADNSDFNTTDFIPAEEGTNYVFSVRGVASSDTFGKPRFITFYDEQKNLINGLNSLVDNVSQFATPANTAFIRITIYTISWTTGSQLEVGTQATSYEPYSKLIKKSLIPDVGIDTLTADVDALQAELDGKDGQEYDLTDGVFGYMKYDDGVFVDRSTAQDYLTIEVAGVALGEKFHYRLSVPAIVTMVAAFDNNGNYLKTESVAGIGSLQDGIYTVGNENISKLKFCCTSANISTYGYKVESFGIDGLSEKVAVLEQIALKNIDPFEGVTLSNLELNASATRNDDGTLTLANGGKAYWGIPTVAVAYSLSAKFIYATGLSFSIGKDQAGNSGYGGRIVLRDGYIDYYKNSLDDGTYTHTTEETGITLNDGEEYAIYLHRTFNYENAERKISVEIFGQYNEHYEIVLNSGPWYGRPFISASGAGCIVLDFNFSLHLDYDLRNALVGVWGHSYVEADSLPGTDRLLSFTNLLGNVFGHDKLFNFGWGGDYAQRLLTRIQGESLFTRAIGYALIVIGANDTSYQLSQVEQFMEDMGVYLIGIGITPIFATQPPIPAKNETANQFLADLSDWVKQSGYKYVDMRQVFLDANGNVRTGLYLADNTHPTVEGHQLIFNRIKMDCPYLF